MLDAKIAAINSQLSLWAVSMSFIDRDDSDLVDIHELPHRLQREQTITSQSAEIDEVQNLESGPLEQPPSFCRSRHAMALHR